MIDLTERAEQVAEAYEPDQAHRLLGGYLAIMTTWFVGAIAFVLRVRRRGLELPRPSLGDLALFGVATHKLARLIAKDRILSPLRAPFVRYDHPISSSEVMERPRGHGLQHAIGELISCPMCMGQWVASGFTAGSVLAPAGTRLAASMFATLAVSDTMQYLYAGLRKAEMLLERQDREEG